MSTERNRGASAGDGWMDGQVELGCIKRGWGGAGRKKGFAERERERERERRGRGSEKRERESRVLAYAAHTRGEGGDDQHVKKQQHTQTGGRREMIPAHSLRLCFCSGHYSSDGIVLLFPRAPEERALRKQSQQEKSRRDGNEHSNVAAPSATPPERPHDRGVRIKSRRDCETPSQALLPLTNRCGRTRCSLEKARKDETPTHPQSPTRCFAPL